MSILYEKISFTPNSSLIARWNNNQHFTYPLHFHEEYEIIFTVESFGTRYVGDSVESFHPNDLVLLGSKLPHCWQNDEVFIKNPSANMAKAIVIQFESNFLNKIEYPEMAPIRSLLENSQRGISFGHTAIKEIQPLITQLLKLEGFEKFIIFLQLLNKLATTTDYRMLASHSFSNMENDETYNRITNTLQYISANYDRKLTLDEIAAQFHMTSSAFCNYFKRKTGKTLISYINELRIAKACRFLTSTDNGVSEIAFECGFNNLSNFNRTFKNMMGRSPRQYRSLWAKSSK